MLAGFILMLGTLVGHCSEHFPTFVTDLPSNSEISPKIREAVIFQGCIQSHNHWTVWINDRCYTRENPSCSLLCVRSIDFERSTVTVKVAATSRVYTLKIGQTLEGVL